MTKSNKLSNIMRHKIVKKISVNKNFSITLYESYINSKTTPLIVGFADIGITPIMVTGFLLDQLQLPLIGAIKANNLPPSSIVSKYQPSFPMRIYGNGQITIVTSENKFSDEKNPKLASELVQVVLSIAKELKSSMIWCTEGIPTEKVEISRTIQYLSTSEEISMKMNEQGHTLLNAALISGITGGLVAECSEYEVEDNDNENMIINYNNGNNSTNYVPEITIMLSPTASQYPDALTSVTLLKALQLFIFQCSNSNSDIDGEKEEIVFYNTSKLERNAKEIEVKVKEMISPSSQSNCDSDPSFLMYM